MKQCCGTAFGRGSTVYLYLLLNLILMSTTSFALNFQGYEKFDTAYGDSGHVCIEFSNINLLIDIFFSLFFFFSRNVRACMTVMLMLMRT